MALFLDNRDSCKNCGNTNEGDRLYQCDDCGKIICGECDKSCLPGYALCPVCDKHNVSFLGLIDPDA